MGMSQQEHLQQIADDGFSIVESVFESQWADSWIGKIDQALKSAAGTIRSRKGTVYAARNLITELPDADSLWRVPVLSELLTNVLGDDFVMVRALYFDKHPQRTWSLPWHKDMTIAVKDNSIVSAHVSKPTVKSDVPHVEASTELLNNMLTLRIHLDPVGDDNGPLEVIPGSHLNGKSSAVSENQVEKIKVNAGDVLAMRPLISHASGSSTPGTNLHRRIVHFEFSGDRTLPDGLQWYY